MKKRICSVLLVMLLGVIPVVQAQAAAITPSAFQKEEQEVPEVIFIRRMHMELVDCTYKDGEMVKSNKRNEIVTYYVVSQEEESIASIAKCLQITEEDLRAENPDYAEQDSDEIFQRYTHVRIPEVDWKNLSNVYYFIEEGDCLLNIAWQFETRCWEIQKMNPQITDPNLIYANDCIQVR